MKPEAKLLRDIREALGAEPDIVLWRNNVGMLHDVRGGVVRFGLAEGSADLVGVLAPSGRMLALEVKAPAGRVSDAQRRWAELARSLGAFVAVVRSVDDARAAVAAARAEQAAGVIGVASRRFA